MVGRRVCTVAYTAACILRPPIDGAKMIAARYSVPILHGANAYTTSSV